MSSGALGAGLESPGWGRQDGEALQDGGHQRVKSPRMGARFDGTEWKGGHGQYIWYMVSRPPAPRMMRARPARGTIQGTG